jgi:hypothetical protein
VLIMYGRRLASDLGRTFFAEVLLSLLKSNKVRRRSPVEIDLAPPAFIPYSSERARRRKKPLRSTLCGNAIRLLIINSLRVSRPISGYTSLSLFGVARYPALNSRVRHYVGHTWTLVQCVFCRNFGSCACQGFNGFSLRLFF